MQFKLFLLSNKLNHKLNLINLILFNKLNILKIDHVKINYV